MQESYYAASLTLSAALILSLSACISTLDNVNRTLSAVNRGLECADNNDSFRCADSVRLGRAYQELISASGNQTIERDFYAFELDQPGVVEVAIDPVPAEVRVRSQLFNARQEPLLTSAKLTRSKGQSLFYEAPAEEGAYYLLVEGGQFQKSLDPYTFEVTLDTEDAYEVNNTFAQAKAIAVGEPVEAKIWPAGDEDFYKFDVQEAGTLEAALESVPPGLALHATSFNRRQEAVGRRTNGPEGKNLYHRFAVQPGTYYLAVGGRRGQASDETYALRLSMKEGE